MVLHTIFGSAVVKRNGYLEIRSGKHRGRYLHCVVWETVAGRPLPDGWEVHHQDFNKTNNAPENLIAMPGELHPANSYNRCPYTGRFLSRREMEQRYGSVRRKSDDGEVPF